MLYDVPRTQQSLEIRMSKLSNLRNNSIEFKAGFVDQLITSLPNEDFEQFRITYINRIREDFFYIVEDDRIFQMILNLLQVCFVLHEELRIDESFDDYFGYYFYASLESPSLTHRVVNRIIDNGADLRIVYCTEQLIVNRLSWKLYLTTPLDIMREIFILNFTQEELTNMEKFQEQISNVINFSLTEYYRIYSRFNQFVITYASILLFLEMSVYNRQEHQKILLNLNQLFPQDLVEINFCIRSIREAFESDVPDNQDVEPTCSRSVNSGSSISESEYHYDSEYQNLEPTQTGSNRKSSVGYDFDGFENKENVNVNSNVLGRKRNRNSSENPEKINELELPKESDCKIRKKSKADTSKKI